MSKPNGRPRIVHAGSYGGLHVREVSPSCFVLRRPRHSYTSHEILGVFSELSRALEAYRDEKGRRDA